MKENTNRNPLEHSASENMKPGPPKLFPVQLHLRISLADRDTLSAIRQKTGEANTEIVRRLIRDAVKD